MALLDRDRRLLSVVGGIFLMAGDELLEVANGGDHGGCGSSRRESAGREVAARSTRWRCGTAFIDMDAQVTVAHAKGKAATTGKGISS